jgi:hypothetical protein
VAEERFFGHRVRGFVGDLKADMLAAADAGQN